MDVRQFQQARNQAGLSQQQAASELGVSQSYLSMLEKGQRPLSRELARRMVQVYKMSPASLPPSQPFWQPKMTDSEQLAADLAGLGYPGFAYLRSRRTPRNPSEILLSALAQDQLEARLFEALPWLVLKYWRMDPEWLLQQAKLHDLQNRLGFVVALARKASRQSAMQDSRRDEALDQLEVTLRRSLLAREELLAGAHVSESERRWLKKHRSKEARDWNVLSNWRPEALRYVA
jgi:transcriptional regulator with XRE-family HTH domain